MQQFTLFCELHGYDDNILLYQPNTSNYLTMDSKDAYERNLKKQPTDWLYRTKEVNYKWNKNGYRCPEWKDIDWANSIVVMGCSLVVGEGLDEADTISSYMSKELGVPVINLGVPAGTLDVIYYNTLRLVDLGIRPKAVCILEPTLSRTTYFTNPSKNLGPWVLDNNDFYAEYYKRYVEKIPNAELHGYMTLRGIDSAWKLAGVPTRIWDYAELARDIDKARDLAHPGIETVKLWGNSMIKWVLDQVKI